MTRLRSGPVQDTLLHLKRSQGPGSTTTAKAKIRPRFPAQPLLSNFCPMYFQLDHAAVAKITQHTLQPKLPAHDHVYSSHAGSKNSTAAAAGETYRRPRETTPNVVVFFLIPQNTLASDPLGRAQTENTRTDLRPHCESTPPACIQ